MTMSLFVAAWYYRSGLGSLFQRVHDPRHFTVCPSFCSLLREPGLWLKSASKGQEVVKAYRLVISQWRRSGDERIVCFPAVRKIDQLCDFLNTSIFRQFERNLHRLQESIRSQELPRIQKTDDFLDAFPTYPTSTYKQQRPCLKDICKHRDARFSPLPGQL